MDCAEGRGLAAGSINRKMAGPKSSIETDPEIELFVKVSFLAIITAYRMYYFLTLDLSFFKKVNIWAIDRK